LGFESVVLRRKDEKNRQSSIDDLPLELVAGFDYRRERLEDAAAVLYDDMIAAGVAPECARFALPLNTTTRLYMSGNVRSWIHYLQARLAAGVQSEHRAVALAILKIFSAEFPRVAACAGLVE
jgi:thymidylate synthase (FAD)